MEKYFVEVIASGALQVDKITEWTDVDKASGEFYSICATYSKSAEKIDATIVVFDVNFDVVNGLRRHIVHEAKA